MKNFYLQQLDDAIDAYIDNWFDGADLELEELYSLEDLLDGIDNVIDVYGEDGEEITPEEYGATSEQIEELVQDCKKAATRLYYAQKRKTVCFDCQFQREPDDGSSCPCLVEVAGKTTQKEQVKAFLSGAADSCPVKLEIKYC